LDEAIRLRPNSADAHAGRSWALTHRGLSREARGNLQGARADFKAALAAPPSPDNSWAADMARARLAALGLRGVALVIGNGAYATLPRLNNPANDAADVAAQLKNLGFKVTFGMDLALDRFEELLTRFAREVREFEVALVYFAGHGLQHNGVNYLVPVDARIEDEAHLQRLIRLQSLLDGLEAAKAARIVILDACRDNGIAQRIATRGLGRLDDDSTRGAFVVYAAQPNAVTTDSIARNSPFTAALLKHIRTPGLELRALMTRVRSDVVRDSGGSQSPDVSDSLFGEFVLKPMQ
jgi:uncharacterized caspase-like protein